MGTVSAHRVSRAVWVNDDLVFTLEATGKSGDSVARGLHARIRRAVDPCRCAETGFAFAGWTMIALTDDEEACLRRLRPACLGPTDIPDYTVS